MGHQGGVYKKPGQDSFVLTTFLARNCSKGTEHGGGTQVVCILIYFTFYIVYFDKMLKISSNLFFFSLFVGKFISSVACLQAKYPNVKSQQWISFKKKEAVVLPVYGFCSVSSSSLVWPSGGGSNCVVH